MEERFRGKDWSLIEETAKRIYELRMKLEARYGRCTYDSAETIRCWRDARTWRE